MRRCDLGVQDNTHDPSSAYNIFDTFIFLVEKIWLHSYQCLLENVEMDLYWLDSYCWFDVVLFYTSVMSSDANEEVHTMFILGQSSCSMAFIEGKVFGWRDVYDL